MYACLSPGRPIINAQSILYVGTVFTSSELCFGGILPTLWYSFSVSSLGHPLRAGSKRMGRTVM